MTRSEEWADLREISHRYVWWEYPRHHKSLCHVDTIHTFERSIQAPRPRRVLSPSSSFLCRSLFVRSFDLRLLRSLPLHREESVRETRRNISIRLVDSRIVSLVVWRRPAFDSPACRWRVRRPTKRKIWPDRTIVWQWSVHNPRCCRRDWSLECIRTIGNLRVSPNFPYRWFPRSSSPDFLQCPAKRWSPRDQRTAVGLNDEGIGIYFEGRYALGTSTNTCNCFLIRIRPPFI